MRTLAITNRIVKELSRDKRTLALLFLAPIFIMWLLSIMFSANTKPHVTIGTYNVSSALVQRMDKVKNVKTKEYSSKAAAQRALKDYRVDSIVTKSGSDYHVRYANIDSTKTALSRQAFQLALQKTQATATQRTIHKLVATLPANVQAQLGQQQVSAVPSVKSSYQYGDHNTNFFSKVIPVFMGFFVFFFVFLISGIGLLKERTSGTLDRLLATPVRRGEIVAGYMISYGAVAILQTVVIVATTIWLLKVEVVGSLFWVFVINFLLSLVALALGIFISTFASSEFQMVQFIPLVVLPQIFFSGLVPLSGMPSWTVAVSKILPLTYASNAMNDVILKGGGFNAIAGDLCALLIFGIIFVVLNIIGLKRYRKV